MSDVEHGKVWGFSAWGIASWGMAANVGAERRPLGDRGNNRQLITCAGVADGCVSAY
jgi:hypothetical protein